jgi:hypothetical protein
VVFVESFLSAGVDECDDEEESAEEEEEEVVDEDEEEEAEEEDEEDEEDGEDEEGGCPFPAVFTGGLPCGVRGTLEAGAFPGVRPSGGRGLEGFNFAFRRASVTFAMTPESLVMYFVRVESTESVMAKGPFRSRTIVDHGSASDCSISWSNRMIVSEDSHKMR